MTKEKMREIAECYGMRFMRHRGICGVELETEARIPDLEALADDPDVRLEVKRQWYPKSHFHPEVTMYIYSVQCSRHWFDLEGWDDGTRNPDFYGVHWYNSRSYIWGRYIGLCDWVENRQEWDPESIAYSRIEDFRKAPLDTAVEVAGQLRSEFFPEHPDRQEIFETIGKKILDRLRGSCDEDELNDPIDPINTEYLLGESRIHLELDSLEQFGYETEEDYW